MLRFRDRQLNANAAVVGSPRILAGSRGGSLHQAAPVRTTTNQREAGAAAIDLAHSQMKCLHMDDVS